LGCFQIAVVLPVVPTIVLYIPKRGFIMSKYITALTLAVTTLMLSACAMHGTWAFSGQLG